MGSLQLHAIPSDQGQTCEVSVGLDGSLTLRFPLEIQVPPEAFTTFVEAVAAKLTGAPVPEPSPYMTVAEAADYYRSNRQRIYDLISSRRLSVVKEGRRVLILRTALEAHLKPSGCPTRIFPGSELSSTA